MPGPRSEAKMKQREAHEQAHHQKRATKLRHHVDNYPEAGHSCALACFRSLWSKLGTIMWQHMVGFPDGTTFVTHPEPRAVHQRLGRVAIGTETKLMPHFCLTRDLRKIFHTDFVRRLSTISVKKNIRMLDSQSRWYA